MKAKMGRPTESIKDYMLRVRLDKEYLEKLKTIEEKNKLSKSEIVRKGIDEQYERLEK